MERGGHQDPFDRHEAAEAIAVAERAQATVHQHKAAPTWYWGGIGVGLAAMFATYDLDLLWLQIGAAIVYAAVVGGSVALLNRRHGVQPAFTRLPRAQQRRIVAYVVVSVGLSIGVSFAMSLLGVPYQWTATGLLVGTLFFLGSVAFDRYQEQQAAAESGR